MGIDLNLTVYYRIVITISILLFLEKRLDIELKSKEEI